MVQKHCVWKIAGSSIAGSSHLKTNTPCQDAHFWKTVGDRVLVAAVADGAGSASSARVGARLAVKTTVNRVGTTGSELLGDRSRWEHYLLDAVFEAIQLLSNEAERLRIEKGELATTLIIAIADATQVTVAHVGDGGSVVASTLGIKALTVPDRASYCNETTFLTSENALSELKIRTFHGQVRGIAIFTDGIERLALSLPSQGAHPPFFEPCFRFVSDTTLQEAERGIASLLASPRVLARSDDDKTLLLAVWTET